MNKESTSRAEITVTSFELFKKKKKTEISKAKSLWKLMCFF